MMSFKSSGLWFFILVFLSISLVACSLPDDPVMYTLTLERRGEGELTPPEGEHEFEESTEVSLKAEPAEGWVFKEWIGNVAEPESSETSILMKEDEMVKAAFIDTESDYLGYNENTVFTYEFFWHYEDADEPMGEINVKVQDTTDDNIDILVSNGQEWSETIYNPEYQYLLLTLDPENVILLDDYPIYEGVEGYQALYPYTMLDDTLKAVGTKDYNGQKAWRFYGEDLELVEYWTETFTEHVKEVEVLVVPYKGLVRQEMVFDTESQEGEYILERSVIELDEIN